MFSSEKLKKILNNKIVDFKTLAMKMHVPYFKNRQFSQFLKHLCEKNIIASTKNKTYFLPRIEAEMIGVVKVNSKGYAFVKNEEDSVFVLASKLNNAFDGDEVKIKIFKDPIDKNMQQGYVSEIIKRNTTVFVGTVKYFNGYLGLMPFNRNIKGIFRFKNTVGLRENINVKVKIIQYGNPVIIEVIKELGMINDSKMDIILAIEDANVPYEFAFDTMLEAGDIAQQLRNEDLKNRKDLRKQLIITIDGDDTKDFDDAIDVQKLTNGNYRLAVHIADVSYYIQESTALDNEAKLRGTSIYLPGKVIPMLPELLSNGICSLNPGVDRLTITVEIEIDKYGEVQNYQIYRSVINSQFKLTYQQVNNYYQKKFSWNHQKLEKMLDLSLELSSILRNSKIKKGYVDFEIEETKIILNADGKTEKIIPKERSAAEMMIEDFMVLANETVAKFFEKNNLSIIYRIHKKPEDKQIENFQKVINILKINVKVPNHSSHFMEAIKKIKKIRFDNFMKIMLLRTMPKAIYAAYNVGHFGLVLKRYTHFTSPIRRYPDLMVHRMLTKYFDNGKEASLITSQKKLTSLSKKCSNAEQKAVDLERQVCDIKKAELYENRINQSFSGIIVSMQKFGFFVELPDKTNGLVHILTLPSTDGEYKLLENGNVISNGKRKFTIGDEVRTKVTAVSKFEGKIELAVSEFS